MGLPSSLQSVAPGLELSSQPRSACLCRWCRRAHGWSLRRHGPVNKQLNSNFGLSSPVFFFRLTFPSFPSLSALCLLLCLSKASGGRRKGGQFSTLSAMSDVSLRLFLSLAQSGISLFLSFFLSTGSDDPSGPLAKTSVESRLGMVTMD